jgi:hypothetical protein
VRRNPSLQADAAELDAMQRHRSFTDARREAEQAAALPQMTLTICCY